MGKWVICPRHPSNKWFEEYFRNALIYDTPEEFAKKLQYAEVRQSLHMTSDLNETIGDTMYVVFLDSALRVDNMSVIADRERLDPSLWQENNPKPLTEEEAKLLTWEDATQRFLDMAEIKSDEWPGRLTSFRDTLTWPVINAGTVSSAFLRHASPGLGCH